jgi:hypothetical protein
LHTKTAREQWWSDANIRTLSRLTLLRMLASKDHQQNNASGGASDLTFAFDGRIGQVADVKSAPPPVLLTTS